MKSPTSLTDTVGHRIRQALDVIAGKPTGRTCKLNGRTNNTMRLSYISDLELDSERDDWLLAIARFRQTNGRAPDMKEALAIAKSMGYRKYGQ